MKGEGLLVLLAPSCERGFGHVGRGAKKISYVRIFGPPSPEGPEALNKISSLPPAADPNSRPPAVETCAAANYTSAAQLLVECVARLNHKPFRGLSRLQYSRA